MMLSVDVFNLFNFQGQTGQDQRYTGDNVSPIPGGSRQDLATLRTIAIVSSRSNGKLGASTYFSSKSLQTAHAMLWMIISTLRASLVQQKPTF